MNSTVKSDALISNQNPNKITRVLSFTEELGTNLVFKSDPNVFKNAHVTSMEQYDNMYKESIEYPEKFWTNIADSFFWQSKWTGKFMEYNFDLSKGNVFVKFMEGGKTNICYNVLDRNINEKKLGDKVAFYW